MNKVALLIAANSVIMLAMVNCSDVKFQSFSAPSLAAKQDPGTPGTPLPPASAPLPGTPAPAPLPGTPAPACNPSPQYGYEVCQANGNIGYRRVLLGTLPACEGTTELNREPEGCQPLNYRRCRDEEALVGEQLTGRQAWMTKCASQIPQIKVYLDVRAAVAARAANVPSAEAEYMKFLETVQYVYPILTANGPGYWQAPTSSTASCSVPGGLQEITDVCSPGCHTPEQRLHVDTKGRSLPIGEAEANGQASLAVVSADSSIDRITVKTARVGYFISSKENENHDIIVIDLSSGQKLRLTPNHPLVGTDGEIHLAASVKAGDELLRPDGGAERVVAVAKDIFFGRVHNVAPVSTSASDAGDLIIAEGVVQGSHIHQLKSADLVGRKLLRFNLTKDLF